MKQKRALAAHTVLPRPERKTLTVHPAPPRLSVLLCIANLAGNSNGTLLELPFFHAGYGGECPPHAIMRSWNYLLYQYYFC
jgi:hypothetical protein